MDNTQEQAIVDQMLAMQAQQGNPDPAAPATNAVSQEPAAPAANPAQAPAPATEGAPTETAQAAASGTAQTETAKTSPAPSAQKEPINLEETFDKSSRAFAEQRLKLKQQNDLMMRFAQMAQIPATNPEEAFAKLSGLVTQQEAKAKNLDPVFLKAFQEQEAKLAAYEQEEIKKEANASFLELQKTFNLDTKDLTAFAKQLSAEGINPFATRGINLSQQYLSMNYTKLLERAREQGRAEEAERQKRIAQSTTPGQTTGQSPTSQTNTPASTGDAFKDFAKLLGIGN